MVVGTERGGISLRSEETKPSVSSDHPKSKSRPVKVYLTVLFLVSLLLLTMSFFMQQRSHQALENLNASMSSNEDIVQLKLDKQKLEFQLQSIEKDLEKAKADQETWNEEKDRLERQSEALEWLRQIEQAGQASQDKARELIQAFQKKGLEDALPDRSVVDGGTSPAETYRNLYAMMF